MDPISKLVKARKILFHALETEIIQLNLDSLIYQLKIVFSQGSILFIRYNEFDEYAYQVIFSKRKGDFVRFDNFDDRWLISTKPHHFHTKYYKKVTESSMTGDPEHDMPILIEYLKKELAIKID